ncbi:hypothetical protein ACNIS6_26060, partial [Escherichia coli]
MSVCTVVRCFFRWFKIYGDVLQDYCYTDYLSEEQSQKIKDVVVVGGSQDNTLQVPLESEIRPFSEIHQ